jgi:hypothetical protein
VCLQNTTMLLLQLEVITKRISSFLNYRDKVA